MTTQASMDHYLSSLPKNSLLDKETERSLALQYQESRDPALRDRLFRSCGRFVVQMAHQYHRRFGMNLEDLVQEGNLGLLKGIDRFDPERGVRLLSYSRHWVEAYMRNYVLKATRVVKLGTTQLQRRLFFSWTSIQHKKRAENGYDELTHEDYEDLAKVLGVTVDALRTAEQRLTAPEIPLDAPASQDGSRSLHEMVASDAVAVDDITVRRQQRSRLKKAIAAIEPELCPRQTAILKERLIATNPATLAHLGKIFGLSRERVRQLERDLLNRIREIVRVSLVAASAAA